MDDKIKVSVMCIAYNHEKYIRQALDGILMQKTNFDYEIIVNDDVSTDGTADIIREYAEKYPEKIVAVFQEDNKYSKGVCWLSELLTYVRGEYIAICEGDDCWIDSNKLQLQADVLDSHSECSGCGHNVKVVDEMGYEIEDVHMKNSCYSDKTLKKHIKHIYCEGRFAHTCSLMFRKNIFESMSVQMLSDYGKLEITGDLKLNALMLGNGDFYFYSIVMGCYRYITSHGESWSASVNKKNITKYLYSGLSQIEKFMIANYNIFNTHRLLSDLQLKSSIHQFFVNPNAENRESLSYIVSRWEF